MEITTETKVGAFIIAACAIFMYMNYKIGTLRFDTARYAPYSIHFNDVAGLERKADIKIAGVKVGWVNDVRLLEGGNQAQADIMVLKDYTLRSDAVAAIRQDGLLGTKYIELVPGSLNAESVTPGYNIGRPGDSPANIDSILREVQSIAQTLNRTLCNNESNINGILSDFRNVAADIKDAIPAFKNILTIKEFRELFWNTQFYEPPTANDAAKRPVYLMDLFTLWGSSAQMSAWSLSDSLLSVLGLQRVQLNDVEKRSKLITTFFSKKESAPTALKDLWDAFFKDLYNKDFSGLPTGSDKILKTEFDSKVVSVLSYGTVGKVTYKLYGILQQVEKGEEKEYKLIHLYTL